MALFELGVVQVGHLLVAVDVGVVVTVMPLSHYLSTVNVVLGEQVLCLARRGLLFLLGG